jgi:hemerythrin-like metal-binding protein
MQHFKWTKAHAIFLPEIDAEHRNIFRMAEELQQAVRVGAEAARVQELARPLAVAIEEHFAHEERLMRSVACPDAAWHKSLHDGARRKMGSLFAQIEEGDVEAAREFIEYLGRWFRDHMALPDLMMGAHVRNYERLHALVAS